MLIPFFVKKLVRKWRYFIELIFFNTETQSTHRDLFKKGE
jgi:hypothetical protein